MTDPSNFGADPFAEFANSISLARPYRFCIHPDGTIHFGLQDTTGKVHYFNGSPAILGQIALECSGLATAVLTQQENPHPELSLDTVGAFVGTMIGNGSEGTLMLSLMTSGGTLVTTVIGPVLANNLASQLLDALALIPESPDVLKSEYTRVETPGGKGHDTQDAVTYFGQEYRADILQMLGLIIVRASALEAELVNLLSLLGSMKREAAEAIFYSSQNNKARLDMMRALVPIAPLADTEKEEALDILKMASSVAERRNHLVHGEWEFKKDKFIVREKKSAAKSSSQEPIATLKSIRSIAYDFNNITVQTRLLIGIVSKRLFAWPNKPPSPQKEDDH